MWIPLPATVTHRSPSLPPPASGWKSLLAAVALGGLSVLPAHAQLNYKVADFSNTTTTYTSILGDPATLNIALAGGNADNGRSATGAAAQTIGFPFSFQGKPYTQFVFFTDGFIRLGTTSVGSYPLAVPSYNGQSIVSDGAKFPPISYDDSPFGPGTNSVFYSNLIAPFNHDMVAGTATLGVGQTRYMKQLSGTAGNQVLTIEWYDLADKQETDATNIQTPPQFSTFSFQLKLYEATGRIEFVYGAMTPTANTLDYQVAQIGIRGLNNRAGQAIQVQKLETQPWAAAVAVNAPFGGIGRNFLLPDGFEYRRDVLPTAGRTFRFDPVTANTNNASLEIYSQGKIAVGVDFLVRARVSNQTAFNTASPITVELNVTGPGGFTFTDTKTVAAGLVPHSSPNYPNGAPPNANVGPNPIPAQAGIITFAPFNPPTLGNYVQTVTITSTDDQASDNTSTYTSDATSNTLSYASAAPAAGQVGFTVTGTNPTGTGIVLARFYSDAADVVNFAQADFAGGASANRSYRVVVYSSTAPATGGTPSTLLGASTNQLTPAAAGTVNVSLPNINVPAGYFFVGIEQLSSNNVAVSYEAEEYLRPGTFFVKFGTGLFSDATPNNNPFRFSIGVQFARTASLPALCVTSQTPVDNSVDVPLSGNIQFSANPGVGGANTPDSYIVYLSTSLSAVTNELNSAKVDSITTNTYAYTGLLTNTTYYYKVVARNFLGRATGCSVVSFLTVPAAPANDNCAAAAGLTIKAFGACGGTNGTTRAATEGATEPTCSSGIINDVWYTFNSGSSYVSNISLTHGVGGGAATSVGLEILSGGCAGTSIGCLNNVNGNVTFTMVPNTVYHLRVYTNTNAQTAGTFSVCVSQLPNLTITSNQTVPASAYNNVYVNAGTATMTGALTANYVVVRDGATLLTGTSPIQGGTVTVQAGGTIGIGSASGIAAAPAATGSLQVAQLGLSNDANYIYTNQSVGVTGAGLPTTVRSLTTSSSGAGDLSLTNSLSIRQMLTLNSGSLDVSLNTLTLMSDRFFTAMVVNTGAGTVVGSARVMRWLSPALNGGFGYRHLTSPVLNAPISDFGPAAGFGGVAAFVNPAYNTPATRATLTGANFPNVFRFDETIAASTGSFVEGYQSPNATTDVIQQGRGYAVNLRPTTLDFVGTLGNGNINIPVTNNGTTDFGAGWNLAGNPYPGPMDWDLVPAASLTAAGVAAAVYVHKSTGYGTSGNYSAYTNGVGTPGTELIPMGQGFFVQKTTPGNDVLTLTNASRLTTYANPALNRGVETRPLLALSVVQAGRPALLSDQAFVYFEQGATTNGDDMRYDAQKLPSTGEVPTLYTRAPGAKVAINGLPALTGAEVIVPLVADVTVTGTYVLNADQLINIPTGMEVVLVDALTGTTQNLSVNPQYTFQATAGNTTPRFTLHFRTAGVTGLNADQALASQLDVYPNPANGETVRVTVGGLTAEHVVTVTLLNAVGQVVSNQQVPVTNAAMSTELDVRMLASGLYTVRVVANGHSATRTVVVE